MGLFPPPNKKTHATYTMQPMHCNLYHLYNCIAVWVNAWCMGEHGCMYLWYGHILFNIVHNYILYKFCTDLA